ncbi:MAG: SiaB family protein kinase [Pseudomonadota bacterium]
MLNHVLSFYEELHRDGVMFCFRGPTSQGLLEGIGQTLKRKMELEDVGTPTIQRVFSLFVEQMQNILRYSTEKTSPHADDENATRQGLVIVGRRERKFYVICGNKTQPAQSEKLLERIRYLQQLDKKELNELYRRLRREEPAEDSKGAGLGLIEMFRRASEPLECRVAPIDSETVFFFIKAMG